MQLSQTLAANTTVRVQYAGSYFLILDDGGSGAVVDLKFRHGSQVLEEITTAGRGTKARLSAGKFTAIDVTADRACTLQLVISDGYVDVDFFGGAKVNATIVGPLPVPVSNDRGAPGNPIYVNGTVSGVPAATAVVDDLAVAVTAAVTVLAAANANRIRLVFTNLDPTNAVAIGSPTLTWAKRAIVLQPGDTWVEERGPNLAWSAICDAGKTATVGMQEVTA